MDYQKLIDELFTKSPLNRSFTVLSADSDIQPSTDDQIKRQVWDRIQNRLKKDDSAYRQSWYISRVAASFALLIVFTSILYFQFARITTNHVTSTGSVSEHLVADGIMVHLNAESSSSFSKPLSSFNRTIVSLQGEAMFTLDDELVEITLSDYASMSSSDGNFTVFNRNSVVMIKSLDAFVSIIFRGVNNVIAPGQSVNFNLANAVLGKIYPTTVKNFASWIRGEFYFENLTLRHALDEFRRQFGIEVTGNGLTDITLANAQFTKSQGWEKSLSSLLGSTGLRYEFNPETSKIEIKKGII